MLKIDRKNVRVLWHEGSSTFGNGYHAFDIAEAAVTLSRLADAPVRLQLMRWDEQGWTRYGEATLTDMKGAIDANGNMVAYQATQTHQSSTSLAATRVLLGEVPGTPGTAGTNAENLGPFYKVSQASFGGNYRTIGKTVTQSLGMFQSGTLRAPAGPQTNFAAEQLIDQLAHEANMDPLSFRRQNMRTDGDFFRWTAVLEAAVAASGYKAHVAATNLGKGNVVEGWGMAIGTHGASRASGVAHIQVDKSSGKITILHLVAGQDSGSRDQPGPDREPDVGQPPAGREQDPARGAPVLEEPGHEPGLGQLPDAALQGAPEGDDGRRRPERPDPDGLRRAAAGSGRCCCRQRVLRRNRRAHVPGAVDAGPRARRAGRPGQGLLVHALPKLERIGPARARSVSFREIGRATCCLRHDERSLNAPDDREIGHS